MCMLGADLPRIKVLSVLFATALAHRVFPVPGGPYSNTPFGGSIPRLANFSGCCGSVSNMCIVVIAKTHLKQR